MADLGILKAYDLRQIWTYEDRNFTVWLCDNLERLSDALGMTLELQQREKAVGPFSADVLAHDAFRDRYVVIENQLEQTDHDHLGKLITYAAGLQASAIVWISAQFREQHRAAIDWLNNHTDESIEFFGVVLEAVQIDDSKPAVNFRVVASPNNWQKSFVGRRGEAPDDDRLMYFYQFNEVVLDELQQIGSFDRLPAPTARYEVTFQRTHRGIAYMTLFSRTALRVAVSIAFSDTNTTRRVFELLQADRTAIEAAMGSSLNWDFVADRRRQIISLDRSGVNRDDEAEIPALAKWAADALSRFKNVLEPRLAVIVPQATQYSTSLDANGAVEDA